MSKGINSYSDGSRDHTQEPVEKVAHIDFYPGRRSVTVVPLGSAPFDTQTTAPIYVPTDSPTSYPTFSPTYIPTSFPTITPTSYPTSPPTYSPTYNVTNSPTFSPPSGNDNTLIITLVCVLGVLFICVYIGTRYIKRGGNESEESIFEFLDKRSIQDGPTESDRLIDLES